MTNDWILDVLTDLKVFAHTNGLPALAEQLEDARDMAQIEMASREKGVAGGLCGETATAGCDIRQVRDRRLA